MNTHTRPIMRHDLKAIAFQSASGTFLLSGHPLGNRRIKNPGISRS